METNPLKQTVNQMKKSLILILTVLTVSCYGQTILFNSRVEHNYIFCIYEKGDTTRLEFKPKSKTYIYQTNKNYRIVSKKEAIQITQDFYKTQFLKRISRLS